MSDQNQKVHPFVPELCEQLRREDIDRREFLRTVTCLGVSAPVAFGMAASILGTAALPTTAAAQTPNHGGILRIAMGIQAMKDPSLFTWIEPSNVVRQIADYLVYVGPDNIARPMLAKKWQPSDDLKTWDLWLEENAYFNNGDLFTADDVLQNFVHWTQPESKSTNRTLFGNVEAEKISDFQVRLHLDAPLLPLAENLYQYSTPIMHRGFGTQWDADFERYPIGTGGYELAAFEVGRQAIVRRRSDAHAASWRGRLPHLDEIHYIDIGNESAAQIAALSSQQVDAIYYVNYEDLDIINTLPNINVLNAPASKTGVVRFNVTAAPFDNPKLREAVVRCSDNQQSLDIITKGLGVLGEHHHTASFQPEYAKLPFPNQDLDAAKKALDESGYDTSQPLEVVVGNTQGTWETDQLQVLKEECAKIGLNLNISVLPTSKYWERWDKFPFSLTFWTHRPLAVMVHALAYKTGVPWNESHFSSAAYDDALAKANGTPDPLERSKYMKIMESELQDNFVMVQPFFISSLIATKDKVKDFENHPTQYHLLYDTWIDA
jgi:peptide/nickel transport system substrate-binding protein